jgi:excinuclease ABC subunit C
MDAVLQDNAFTDFGSDSLLPFRRRGLHSVESEESSQLRVQVRSFAPREPGVYGMLDGLGRLIYVGKSKSLRNRLLSYFLPNNEEDKSGRIVQSTRTIVWERQPSEFAALLREQFLIRQFQPRFNVQGIPRRQQPVYICLGRGPAEQLYTAKRRDPKASYVLGPLSGVARANRAVEILNRLLGLRDCSSKQPCSFTEQLSLFELSPRPGCIRLEIETCLGPCISACSRKAYDQHVNLARDFLAGNNAGPMERLRKQMEQAATNLHFERAAVLREDLRILEWIHRRAVDMATARQQYTFVYPVTSHTGLKKHEVWYLIRRGMIEGALAAPTTSHKRRQVEDLLRQWYASDNSVGTRFVPRIETLALVTSWFRKHRQELKSTFVPPLNADAVNTIDCRLEAAHKSTGKPSPVAKHALNSKQRKIVKV